MRNLAGRGLPKPVAHLIVETGKFPGLNDMHVVAKAVENLRTVILCVNRLHHDALDVRLGFRAVSLRVRVNALIAVPGAGKARQRPEVGKRIRA